MPAQRLESRWRAGEVGSNLQLRWALLEVRCGFSVTEHYSEDALVLERRASSVPHVAAIRTARFTADLNPISTCTVILEMMDSDEMWHSKPTLNRCVTVTTFGVLSGQIVNPLLLTCNFPQFSVRC